MFQLDLVVFTDFLEGVLVLVHQCRLQGFKFFLLFTFLLFFLQSDVGCEDIGWYQITLCPFFDILPDLRNILVFLIDFFHKNSINDVN